MAKIKRDELVGAAKDLNKVLGLEPPINTNTTKEKELVTALSEVVDMIDETDEIKDSTREVLVQLGFIQPDVEDVDDDELEEEEEADAEVNEDVEEFEDIEPTPPTLEELMDLISECNSTKELKEIIKRETGLFDGFTPSAKVKNVIDLRTAMLDFLEKEEKEEVEEVEDVIEKPKKDSNPVKKEVEKKVKETVKTPIKDKNKKLGVIATIADCIKSSKDGITKDEIFEILKTTFPERNINSMRSTINIQVPSRLSKEKFKVLSKTQPDGTKLYFCEK